MIKIRTIFVFALLPLAAGFYFASAHGQKLNKVTSSNYNLQNILPSDKLIFIDQGNIVLANQINVQTLHTKNPQLIEAVPLGENILAVNKQTNYSSINEYALNGSLENTILNGKTNDIDTMDWYTDPTIQPNQQNLAFVSDRNKEAANVYDNALFVENLTTNTITKLADPVPSSGGIAHPVWDPTNNNIIAYDYYEYDQNYNPYSIINEYNIQTQVTNALTTQNQNAYQGSFSPNGKKFIFLGRNSDYTVTIYIADLQNSGLTNIHSLATGDFAYPEFSNTPGHIYYMQAEGNGGYDLYSASIANNQLTNNLPITTDSELLANSGFSVIKQK